MTLPIRHKVGKFPSYMWPIEVEIINLILAEALKEDRLVSVYDGEDWALLNSRDLEAIQAEVAATDETSLIFREADLTPIGSVWLVHGNMSDVIADYSDNEKVQKILDPALERSNAE